MRRLLCVSFGCVVLAAAFAARADDPAKSTGLNVDKLQRMSAVLQEAVDKKQLAGASMLVKRNGRIASLAVVGVQDLETKTPMTDATIFRIASMSKPITAAAALILVDDGKLKTTDPLSKFLPEFKEMKVLVPGHDGQSYETVPARREITIHDLMNHTAGFTYQLFNKPIITKIYADAGLTDGLVPGPTTIGDNVAKLAKLPLVSQPGSAWQYGLSNDVLGRVIEVASGQTLEQFMQERLFKPLKMVDTSFILPKDKQARLATTYAVGADRTIGKPQPKPAAPESNRYFSGGAGLYSTIGDYGRFSQMLLNRGELDGARVLQAETVDRMLQNQLGDVKMGFPLADQYGYSISVLSPDGKARMKLPEAAGTNTWAGAYGTFFWIDPKNKIAGVYMTQLTPPDFMTGLQMKKLTYEVLEGAGPN